MLKREIVKLIKGMEAGDVITFYTPLPGYRADSIEKISIDSYEVYSHGQNWSDQRPEPCDFKTAIKWIWAERPESFI